MRKKKKKYKKKCNNFELFYIVKYFITIIGCIFFCFETDIIIDNYLVNYIKSNPFSFVITE